MPEKVAPGPVCEERSIREAVCIHTKKIFDSCRDKDCIEDLRVYPTRCSQEAIDRALSVKAGTAELLYAYIDVEPVSFNRGFYTVDVRYFYRITADAFVGAARPLRSLGWPSLTSGWCCSAAREAPRSLPPAARTAPPTTRASREPTPRPPWWRRWTR